MSKTEIVKLQFISTGVGEIIVWGSVTVQFILDNLPYVGGGDPSEGHQIILLLEKVYVCYTRSLFWSSVFFVVWII